MEQTNLNDMEDKDYKCRNGAYHDTMCCPTCWNGHPLAESGKMFLGTKEQEAIVKDVWLNKALLVGFTREQAEFLYTSV